jgi:hypothetical protein
MCQHKTESTHDQFLRTEKSDSTVNSLTSAKQ